VSAEHLLGVLAAMRPEWWDDAACLGVGPDPFFVGRGKSLDEARGYCSGCPVRAECVASAVAHHERFGIWAGQRATNLRPGNLPETLERLVASGCADCGAVA
jgi:hypothetical protein